MFITPAYAQSVGGGSQLVSFLPLILVFAVFYFLLIRPQVRQRKEHQNMLNQLRRGDKIVTGGGIIGTVTKVNNDGEITVQIAEGVKVVVARGTIANVLTKPNPASGAQPVVDNDNKPKGLLGMLMGGGKK